jgi:hypothetical protein
MQPNQIDPDLPDEIAATMGDEFALKQEKLNMLGMLVARKRDEAVSGRVSSGIETIWEEDEDSYEGVDDANRSEARVVKANTNAGGLTRKNQTGGTRSTMFLNITRPYVDSAAARVCDMLMPTDDRSFELKADPIPEMTADNNKTPALDPATGQQLQVTTDGPEGQTSKPATAEDMAAEVMTRAQASADAAQTRIDDWLVECQYHAEKRKAIHDCAKIGVCVLKGPVPAMRTSKALNRTVDGVQLQILKEIKPESRRIDPHRFYPDPSCGENIHNGNFCVEQDFLTEKKLLGLKGVPGYLDDQIDKCIEEGPQKQNVSDSKGRDRKNLYEVWYYYGSIKSEDLQACDTDLMGKNGDTQYAVITMVNDRVIKAALNH